MEGGQKYNINLEAGLDPNTSDMLVPVTQPTVQHNWQKWQGKCLPNSLRFEHNGWAAGWNVYEFKYDNIKTKLDDIYYSVHQVNDLPSYMLCIYDTNDSTQYSHFLYFTVDYAVLDVVDCFVEFDNGLLTGKIGDKNINLVWNTSLETFSAAPGHDLNVAFEYSIQEDNSFKIMFNDTSSAINADFTLYKPSAMHSDEFNDVRYTEYLNGVHKWGDSFTYNETTEMIHVQSIDSDIPSVLSDNNLLSASYSANETDYIVTNFDVESVITGFSGVKVVAEDGSDNFSLVDRNSNTSITSAAPFNELPKPEIFDVSNKAGLPSFARTIFYNIPLWVSLKLTGFELYNPGIQPEGSSVPSTPSYTYFRLNGMSEVMSGEGWTLFINNREWGDQGGNQCVVWSSPNPIQDTSTGKYFYREWRCYIPLLGIKIDIKQVDALSVTLAMPTVTISSIPASDFKDPEEIMPTAGTVDPRFLFGQGSSNYKRDDSILSLACCITGTVPTTVEYIPDNKSKVLDGSSSKGFDTLSGYSYIPYSKRSYVYCSRYKPIIYNYPVEGEVEWYHVDLSFSMVDGDVSFELYENTDKTKVSSLANTLLIDYPKNFKATNWLSANIIQTYITQASYASNKVFIPGVALKNAEDSLLELSDMPLRYRLKWDSYTSEDKVSNVAVGFVRGGVFEHNFINELMYKVNNSNITVNASQTEFTIKLDNNVTLNAALDATTHRLNISSKSHDYTKAVLSVAAQSLSYVPGETNSLSIALGLTLIYDIAGRFTKVSSGYELLDVTSGSLCDIKLGNNTFNYDIDAQVSFNANVLSVDTTVPYTQHIKLTDSVIGVADVVVPYASTPAYFTPNVSDLKFEYNEKEYTIGTASLLDNKYMDVVSCDIRDSDKVYNVGKIDITKELQPIKQQWNSTNFVENYWWVDKNHILELNKYSFVLKRKLNTLSDWDGDNWEIIYEIDRATVITSDVFRYFVPNVRGTTMSRFIVLKLTAIDKLTCYVYDIHSGMNIEAQFDIIVKHKTLGNRLNVITVDEGAALFNTYGSITAGGVLSQAEWSSTIIDNKIIIGCHVTNNMDQWAIIFDLNTYEVINCIQGYGYVGVDGSLTGGQIPNQYFDVNSGFNGTVQPITVLLNESDVDDNIDEPYVVNDISDVMNLDPKVVGNAKQQWYICNTLHGIVSHLKYTSNGYVTNVLPLSNNYVASYKSPSFGSSLIGDISTRAVTFSSLFNISDDHKDNLLKNFATTLLGQFIYLLQPRISVFAYLQQTFGQYAYVHYNSSRREVEKQIENDKYADRLTKSLESKEYKDVLEFDSMSFDKQVFSQDISLFDSSLSESIVAFISVFNTLNKAPDTIANSVKANETQNRVIDTAASTMLSQFASENTEAMLSAISCSSKDKTLTSKITGLKYLDMFYSTSDLQHVYAGPGFVEHQFVADCVAQSVTDVKADGIVIQITYAIKLFTQIVYGLKKITGDLTYQALLAIADATAQIKYVGPVAAVAAKTAAWVTKALALIQDLSYDAMSDVIDNINENSISTCDNSIAKSSTSIEPKHKYGEKNETFMWPCWGVPSAGLNYTDEYVSSGIKNNPWKLTFSARKFQKSGNVTVAHEPVIPKLSSFPKSTDTSATGDGKLLYNHDGDVPFYTAACYGNSVQRRLPIDMAKVEGVTSFLPTQSFRNENISVSDPVFAPSLSQDYIIDKKWQLSQYCTYGKQQWVAVKDTKIIDCPPSNIIINDEFCGIACPYAAVEVKRGLSKEYMRPNTMLPNALAINSTGYNVFYDNIAYHGFDGISYRLVDLIGSPGLNKNMQTFLYSFQVNDRLKRSNKLPANELQGNFESEPIQALNTIDKTWTQLTVSAKEIGMEAGTIGEDKDLIRWAVPIFTEQVNTLPASVKTLTAMPLGVVEGVTSLCTELANNQTAYKAPLSVDFTIGKQVFRATEEYICSVQTQNGIDVVTDLVPALGLVFIGSTPTEAYFYSKATKHYYLFTGGANLVKIAMLERFSDVKKGYWDFVNQNVVMPCTMSYSRLSDEIKDNDTDTDNVIVPLLSNSILVGEVPKPITTIFNDKSGFKVISLPSGLAYQGPNRVIINREVVNEYMISDIKDNLGKWSKIDRERFSLKRKYPEVYTDVVKDINRGVKGWTHNPFVYVTSPLGIDETVDCMFEWEITFCWPVEMDLIYGVDNYATVNIASETMEPGGKVMARPSHVYLTKELFTRSGMYGYYSFTYQSKNGIGNRERLHIWSDSYIAISNIACFVKPVTQKRTSILTQQVDVQNLKEL